MKNIIISKSLRENIEFEMDKCIDCRECMKVCMMLNEFCETPKELFRIVCNENKINSNIPFSCSLCGHCKYVCPKSIDLSKLFLEFKKEFMKNSNRFNKNKKIGSVIIHQKNSFSKLLTTTVRNKKKRVFFPGCSLSSYSPDIVMEINNYLKLENIDIILNCCGNPTYVVGDEERFNNYYSELSKKFEGVDEVIVACQNCYKTIEKYSPDIKIKSLYELIAEIGIPKSKFGFGKNIDIVFSIHDPCPTRMETNIHDSIRKIMIQLDLKVSELEYSRENTMCCGSGGMLMITNKTIALKQKNKRGNQAKSDYVITYCQECVESMKVSGKKSIHILDILFNKNMSNFNQIELSTTTKWINRYKTKKSIDKIR